MVPQIRESLHRHDFEEPAWLSIFGSDRKPQPLTINEVFSGVYPPAFVIVQKRRVRFDDSLEICTVDGIEEKYHDEVWYTEDELAGFEKRYNERKGRKRSLKERDARTYNHSRRVLLHHKAFKEMGDFDRAHSLEYISFQSSQCGKDLSHREAIRLAKEVLRVRKEISSDESTMNSSFEYFVQKVLSFSSQGLR